MEPTTDINLKISQLQDAVDRLEYKVDTQNTQLTHYINRKLKKSPEDEGDENEERGNWSGKLDFLLSCLGYAVGLGNVWRFPYLCYRNGGGAFFIPYCIMLAIVGVPIFFLELSLGQFSSCGPTTVWSFASLFQGIGFAMMIVSAMVAIYYNMIIGWAFYYLFASFTDDLPWADCGNWSTALCDRSNNFTESECTSNGWLIQNDGSCTLNGTIKGLYNETLAKENDLKFVLPSQEYFFREVLGTAYSKDLGDYGEIHWELVLCLLLAWVFVCLTLSNGIKSSGKVVYVTATFPYIVLVILLVRGVLLDGYYSGIKFYIEPDLDKLSDAGVWKDAAVQIFFSLSASWGGLIALASYNKFHNDVFRDALLVSFGNCMTSLFAGFVIFSYLGFLANEQGQAIKDVVDDGPGLAFIVYPMAVTKLPVETLWSILFFVMLITLGVDSEFVLTETVVTSIMDMFPSTRKYKTFTVILVCLVFFILGIPYCFDGGFYLFTLIDEYSGGWNVLVISLCECIAVGYVYGVRRFLRDIETMVGTKVCGFMPWSLWKYWWMICWCCLTPLGVSFILVFSWVDYTRLEDFPRWADALGWGMTLIVIVAIFGTMVFKLIVTPGTFKERLRKLTTPRPEWGPALPKYRQLVTAYVPGFIVNLKEFEERNPDGVQIEMNSPNNGGRYYENKAMDYYETK
ncbi:hypothetical protein RRG08_002273 [Elysia crispata]|uniref:Transporter n=1 Tax=Elysia crispata TaxID=231223 RepID=A0AAE0ZCS8_9GAST|nr:hypothetical protein RRG08_002273 [Elysia crispata]